MSLKKIQMLQYKLALRRRVVALVFIALFTVPAVLGY